MLPFPQKRKCGLREILEGFILIWFLISVKLSSNRYEDGVSTLRKVGIASDFIWSETPLEFLGTVNVISFDDPACDSIKENELTTEEVIFTYDHKFFLTGLFFVLVKDSNCIAG